MKMDLALNNLQRLICYKTHPTKPSSCNNFDSWTRSSRLITSDCVAMLQAREVNPVSSTWRVSDELDISQFSVVCYLHNLGKSVWSCYIIPLVIKIFKKFWFSLVINQPNQLELKNTLTASLQRGKTSLIECPWYDTKQSDAEGLAMLEVLGMWSTPSVPSPLGSLWPGVIAPDMVL